MNPDLYYHINNLLLDDYDDILKMTKSIYMDGDLKEYITLLNDLEKNMNKVNNKKKISLKGLIELYLNCLLLGYQNKLNVEERECFLYQIKSKLESESNHYSNEEVKSFFDINYLEKILFSLNLEESIEYLEVITGRLLKVINSNEVEYINPNKEILTNDLLNSLIAYY